MVVKRRVIDTMVFIVVFSFLAGTLTYFLIDLYLSIEDCTPPLAYMQEIKACGVLI